MRGKVHPAHHAEQGDGITPAYAGKSRCNLPSTAPWKDHPRVCGEKVHCQGMLFRLSGLPPRMRGKDVRLVQDLTTDGITPAYAGKSARNWTSGSGCGDHPRVCGEKPLQSSVNSTMEGSPPRMRGKGISRHGVTHNRGITPAYAGKSEKQVPFLPPYQDHPRVCGEKVKKGFDGVYQKGSPPRMRGKGSGTGGFQSLQGITPAYAGKRDRPRSGPGTTRDHPRVCGEKLFLLGQQQPTDVVDHPFQNMMLHHSIPDTAAHDGRQVLRGLRRHLKCDWDGHLRLIQVGNVVHERALMPDVHESQSRRTPQRHNDRMGQPVQAGMYGGSHGCRGRAAAPKCPPPGSERYPFHPLR